jgi:hypothetical protein
MLSEANSRLTDFWVKGRKVVTVMPGGIHL